MNTTINIQELNNYKVLETMDLEEQNKRQTTKEAIGKNIENLQKSIDIALDLVELQYIPNLSIQLLENVRYFESNYP